MVLMGIGIAAIIGRDWAEGVLIGLALSMASMVLTLPLLRRDGRRALEGPERGLGASWLIIQAVAAICSAIVITTLKQPEGRSRSAQVDVITEIALSLGGFAALLIAGMVLGRRLLPIFLVRIARLRSRELFALAVFALALTFAFTAHAIFGLSFALGAFLAGFVFNQSNMGHRAAQDLLPMRDAFHALFFLSLGMLADPKIFLDQTWGVVAVIAAVTLGNLLAVFLAMTALRLPLHARFRVSGHFAHCGEWAFLVGSIALGAQWMSQEAFALIIVAMAISIALSAPLRALLHLPIWIAELRVAAEQAKAKS